MGEGSSARARPPGPTAGERRIVSVLVADVAGSTQIGEQVGPERSKYLFDEIVGLMREEVERLGGTVAQLTGDGVLVLFGAPITRGDEATRAVAAALNVREAISRYADEVGAAYGIELAARVAVNTGPIVVPASDAPPDVLYNALGDTVNVAARLQALGDVVVGPLTARQIGNAFELEPLGRVELKGKSEEIDAFRVTGRAYAGAAPTRTPLVGRDRELALLADVFDGLMDARGAIVVLTGEAGIGKSRLKSEARQRYRGRVAFLEGHGVSYAGDIPYWPLREVLRDWLELGASETEARARLELKARLGRVLAGDADDVYPFLASMSGISLERDAAERLQELSRDSVRQQTFDAFYRLICALAQERPVALVVEDLHWADEATFRLLEELLAVTDAQPVALVLSFRAEDEHRAWDLAERARRRYRHRFVELELAPLQADDARAVATGAAGAQLPEAVEALLTERSGGNPFFVEEAVRDLLERGVLRRVNGRIELESGGAITVPSAVHEALQARLDRLAPAAREVITVGSVIGRSFALPLLEELLKDALLMQALSELQRLDLIVEERRRPAPEYRFRHGLVQEVAYAGMVEEQRRRLHRAVGEALEQLSSNSQDGFGLLAHHFSEADEPERAVHYLLRAGDAARALFAEQEALEHYERALEFLRRLGDDLRARETLLKVALTHHLAFDFERAGRAFDEAFALDAPEPTRVEPTESVETAYAAGAPRFGFVPSVGMDNVSQDIGRHVYRGLIKIGRELEAIPDLAESVTVSPDGLTYRFRLRPDALWSDGVAVSAHDFAVTWLEGRDGAAEGASLLGGLSDATAVDARTLEVHLREPRSYFLHLLAHPMFMPWPRHVVERLGPRWYEDEPLVTNGPFRLAQLTESDISLVAAESWASGRGNVGSVRIEFGGEESLLSAWRQGRYDVLFGARIVDDSTGRTLAETSPGLAVSYLGFRIDRPPFNDSRVRRAIAHSLDRDRLTAAVERGSEPASRGGFLPPAMPGHSHRVVPGLDVALARRLLAAVDGGSDRPIVIAMLDTHGRQLGRELVQQLAEVGVDAVIESVPFPSLRRFVDEEADAWVWGWVADYPDPDGMLGVFAAEGPFYASEEVRKLVDRARSQVDRDERLRLYREAERVWLGEDVSLVPLWYPRACTLRRPWVAGVWSNGLATSSFAEADVRR